LYSGVRLAGMIASAQKPAPYFALIRCASEVHLRPGAGLLGSAMGACFPALTTDDQSVHPNV
jgi:hypothetical protein